MKLKKSISRLSALVCLLFSTVPVLGQSWDGVRVVSSDATQIELEITPNLSWTSLPSGALLPTVAGASLSNASEPGAPMELRMNLPVGLPQPEGSRFEVLSVEYGSPVFGRIAPVPVLREDSEGIVVPEYHVDEDAYATYVPESPAAEFVYGGIARGLHVGEVRISPLRYVAGGSKVEVVERVRVRVRYGGTALRNRVGASVDGEFLAAFMNSNVASQWVQGPSVNQRGFARRSGVQSARAWLRIEIEGDGLYEITAEDFLEAGVDPGTIGEVAVYGDRGTPLPEEVGSAALNTMDRVPVIVERSGSEVKRVMFYGSGTLGWGYGTFGGVDSVPRRLNNPYVKNRSYIVAIDGESSREFPAQGGVGPATVFPDYGIGRLVFEEELTNAIAQGNSGNGGGRDWFGTSFIVDEFRPEEKRVFTQELRGLDRSYPVTYRVRIANHAIGSGAGTAQVEQNGVALGPEFTVPWLEREQQTANVAEKVYVTDANLIAADNRSLLGIKYRNNKDATAYLDWYEIHYGRKLEAYENRLQFESPTGEGVAEYRVSGFRTSNLIGLDVTDPANPVRLNPLSTDGGDYVFRDGIDPDVQARRSYFIGSPDDAKSVKNVSKAKYGGLRETDGTADILVITHEDLREAAEEYVAYRNGQGRLRATYVTTDEIYTEYSGGNLDPTAIRDYVYDVYHNWSVRPKYLLLLGDASFDYRGLNSSQKQYVPVYEKGGDGTSYNDIDISAFDDYYARVDGEDFYIDIALGRIAVDNVEDAMTVIDKIKRYEGENTYGDWRRRVVLVSDDRWPVEAGGTFIPQSEGLEEDFLPGWIETEKIYLAEYPTVQGARRSKPGATQDLLQWLNRGALIVNWVGHGNAKVWGHEHILDKDVFVPQLTNDTALTMVIAVTCNFGRFDNPTEVSGGELFLTHKNGGAVATLATTRAVYISDNERLMRAYFSSLFFRDSTTRDFLPLGEAMFAAKTRSGASASNDEKYIIFGDPSMRLNLPRDSVQITSINSIAVADDTVTVGALSVVTVEGVVRNRKGEIREDFNGTAILTLYDADQHKLVQDESSQLAMVDRGGQLYRGPAIVENGRFTGQFRVPQDISFDSATGRLYAYAFTESEDAAGGTAHIRVYGSSTVEVTDKDGPDINVYLDDRSFRTGDVVTPTPMLIVDLQDTSGINASGAGLGHRIEAWIGESSTPIDLTEFYTTSPTDYREGSAERELLDLEPGEYKVRVRAWDIFNNPSQTTTYFRVVAGEQEDLVVTEVANYPNPMGKETEFLFRHNQSVPLDVQVDIYTASGRKIRRLERRQVTDRFVRIPWDGHDTDGGRVANGVYFYRLRVEVAGEEGKSVEVIDRVAVAQ